MIAEPTVDEIVALLSKTTLPTVVVEGRDDMIVYRRFEEFLNKKAVSFLSAGGRSNVIEVYRKVRDKKLDSRVIFVADRDVWVNSSVPEEFACEFFLLTDGYSIENDVYRDGGLENYLMRGECDLFFGELHRFVNWYCLSLSRKLMGGSDKICLHPVHVLDNLDYEGATALMPGEVYPSALRDELVLDYKRLLRGKSLLALLVRTINRPGREPKHHSNSLMESVALNPGKYLTALRDKVDALFN